MTSGLLYESLAFTSPRPDGAPSSNIEGSNDDNVVVVDELVASVARAPFVFDEFSTLNVELFGDSSWPRILCFVPGVCESAETWAVQNLARTCRICKWQLAVLELEGHGLSSGPRGLLSGDMDRLVRQVLSFCRHVVVEVYPKRQRDSSSPVTFAVSGASLGGVLAAYASQRISNSMVDQVPTSPWTNSIFVGTLLISPSVGVDPAVVPPKLVVFALAAISMIAPSAAFMTPVEDPSHYNCPPWSNRNYEGSWPLGTAKLLLDITSKIVPSDVQEGTLNLELVPELVVISGNRDPVVPIGAVRSFVEGLALPKEKKELTEMAKGDHCLLAHSSKSKVTSETLMRFQSFLAKHVC
jgi:alpha-beta hydrolase superfamily lysophospholipase